MRSFAPLAFALSLAFLASCASGSSEDTLCTTTDYGSDVRFFACTGSRFGNSLATYLATHPDLEVAAMTGNGTGGHGRDTGYYVVFRRRSS